MNRVKREVIAMTLSSDKSPGQRAFAYYLRTGRRLPPDMFMEGRDVELKFNPYHDPRNGQYTFAPGGAGTRSTGRVRNPDPRALAKPPTYTVRKGDTLSHIARRHGVRTDALASANAIKHPDHIEAGQRLRIPQTPPKAPHQHPAAKAPDGSGQTLVVTDGARTPQDQAERIYYKFSHGDFSTYKSAQADQLAAVYRRGRANGKPQSQILSDMSEIIDWHFRNAKPISKHLLGRGVDFRTRDMTLAHQEALKNAIRKNGGKIQKEGVPPHIHASF